MRTHRFLIFVFQLKMSKFSVFLVYVVSLVHLLAENGLDAGDGGRKSEIDAKSPWAKGTSRLYLPSSTC